MTAVLCEREANVPWPLAQLLIFPHSHFFMQPRLNLNVYGRQSTIVSKHGPIAYEHVSLGSWNGDVCLPPPPPPALLLHTYTHNIHTDTLHANTPYTNTHVHTIIITPHFTKLQFEGLTDYWHLHHSTDAVLPQTNARWFCTENGRERLRCVGNYSSIECWVLWLRSVFPLLLISFSASFASSAGSSWLTIPDRSGTVCGERNETNWRRFCMRSEARDRLISHQDVLRRLRQRKLAANQKKTLNFCLELSALLLLLLLLFRFRPLALSHALKHLFGALWQDSPACMLHTGQRHRKRERSRCICLQVWLAPTALVKLAGCRCRAAEGGTPVARALWQGACLPAWSAGDKTPSTALLFCARYF